MLEARGAGFRYPGRDILLHEMDLIVEPGERIAVLGRNGSGKSTFLRCLAGITPPTFGRVLIDGLDPSDPRGRAGALALIGFLFEAPEEQALAPTVEREIAFGLENRGVERSRMRSLVGAALERFDLAPLASRHPSTLSGGERQRLALASVFVEEPRYLFLDEPTSRLDAAGRDNFDCSLASLTPKPAIIEVTLRCEQAEKADRVLLLSGGRVQPAGPPSRWGEGSGAFRSGEGRAGRPPGGDSPGSAREPLLKGEGLCFAPAGMQEPVFQGISLDGCRGEAVIIVGPTACGKTTLLRMLAGFEAPTSGAVSRKKDSASRIAYMPQFPERLLFAPTVLEDVAFGAQRSGASRSEADVRARDCLEAVHLDAIRFGSIFPGDLSYGERRRVALAGLLTAVPRVVLLDEPEVGLDSEGRATLREILVGLLNRGTAVAVATHEPEWLSGVPGKTVSLERTGGSRTVVVA